MAVIYLGNRRIKAEIGNTLLEALQKGKVNISSLCGGRGLCGKCKVVVQKGYENIDYRKVAEEEFLNESEIKEGYRLSCLTKIIKDGEIYITIPLEWLRESQRMVIAGKLVPVEIKPTFIKFFLKLNPATLTDVLADRDRIQKALESSIGKLVKRIDLHVLRKIPVILRESDWKITVGVWNEQEIITVEIGDKTHSSYGFALDIGTSKLAGYLVDLNSGKIITSESVVNPQTSFGEDIIARITFASENERNLEEIHKILIEKINQLIRTCCKRSTILTDEITDMVIAGNTVMQQLFLKITPFYLGKSPFVPLTKSHLDVKARELGVRINKGSYIHILPQVAGYVGGDAVADVIATELNKTDAMSLLIDIGTNTELLLGNREQIWACSCASGPAFEGAHVKFGTHAKSGAIEKIWINPLSLEVSYETIGRGRPTGICGSGIIDAISEMFIKGIIDRTGKIQKKEGYRRIRNDEFIVAYASETALGADIVITQRDVREIQYAKAAIYTGITILMKHARIPCQEIEKVFMAGSFGTYVDPASARNIGMIPDIPLNRIEFVGNTAGSGACLALINKDVRREAEDVVKMIKYVELAAEPNFQTVYFNSLNLPNENIGEFPTVQNLISKYRFQQ
jgi:uncharacterized 2Fe-2S/4Fe-4S cluster protein (DUF4445 family)